MRWTISVNFHLRKRPCKNCSVYYYKKIKFNLIFLFLFFRRKKNFGFYWFINNDPQFHTPVSATQGLLLFSPPNPSVPHKFANWTDLSAPHVSSTPVRQFQTNLSGKLVRRMCGTEELVWNWRVYVELSFGTGGFRGLKSGSCVELMFWTDWCVELRNIQCSLFRNFDSNRLFRFSRIPPMSPI